MTGEGRYLALVKNSDIGFGALFAAEYPSARSCTGAVFDFLMEAKPDPVITAPDNNGRLL